LLFIRQRTGTGACPNKMKKTLIGKITKLGDRRLRIGRDWFLQIGWGMVK